MLKHELQRAGLWLFSICLLVLGVSPAAAKEERWNIVSIVTDDQAKWAVGAYGNKEVRTPNMDRIAREGARFANAFVNTPVCSPSRASFLTGLHATRFGITDFISASEDRGGLGLPTDAITWPRVLQQTGYRTGLVGKWHLGSKPQFHPTRFGYDYFYGIPGGGAKPNNPRIEVNGVIGNIEGHTADLWGDAAVEFIDEHSTQPFALSLHFREPHLPYRPMPQQDVDVFEGTTVTIPEVKGIDEEQVQRWTRDYYISIHAADRNVGRVLDKLDALGLTSRTIVLFTSDHGYNIGHHRMHAKGNGNWIAGGVGGPKRPNMFETSIRVPLLIRWPGKVQPGTVVQSPASNVDVFPTVLSMLGVTLPTAKLDGRDFSSELRGEKNDQDIPVFGQYDLHNGDLAYMRMIRTKDWKLVRHYFVNGMDELYNISKDHGERNNLYGKKEAREIQSSLQEQLTKWQRSINDPILERLPESALSSVYLAGEDY